MALQGGRICRWRKTSGVFPDGCIQVSVVLCAMALWFCGCCQGVELPPVPERAPDMVNSIGMGFRWIPRGEAMLGSPKDEPYRDMQAEIYAQLDGPSPKIIEDFRKQHPEFEKALHDYEVQHRYVRDRGFYLGIAEVTNAQFRQYDPKHVSKVPLDYMGEMFLWAILVDESQLGFSPNTVAALSKETLSPNGNFQPVTCVMPKEARGFCKWLSDLPQEKAAGRSYRLPTSQEWEYACRAGTTGRFYWKGGVRGAGKYENFADVPSSPKAWPTGASYPIPDPFPCADGYLGPAPVCSLKANPWGLHDMLGNVKEFTEYVPRSSSDRSTTNPAKWTTVKGGSWMRGQWMARAAFKSGLGEEDGFVDIGFRIVLVKRPVPTEESIRD
jgi:formylglycine-generating enzyme required for sulfatase activity